MTFSNLECTMRVMWNMLRRRQRYHGGKKALAGYLPCDVCGNRFESGVVRLEKKYVIAAVCNACTAQEREPLDLIMEQAFDPSFRRRIKGIQRREARR
jgi:hypothetical protein